MVPLGELVEQARAGVHVAHEVAHLGERGVRRADDDVDALAEHGQLVVGDEGRHLDQGVGLEDSPVISQSIQTMRSVCARSVPGVVMGAMLGRGGRRAAAVRVHCTRVACHEWGPRAAAADAARRAATPRPGRPCAGGCSPGSPPSASSSPRSSCRAYLGAAFGVQTALLALAVALVPLGIVIPTFLWLDRFESEPTRYLRRARSSGARSSRPSSPRCSTPAPIAVLEATTDPQAALQTTAVLVAPFVEEAAKGALVLLVVVARAARVRRGHRRHGLRGHLRRGVRLHREHPVPRAGLRRAAAARRSPAPSWPGACCRRSPTRCSPCSSGSGVGVAATSRTWLPRILAPVLGYLLAVLSHALWNLAAVVGRPRHGRGLPARRGADLPRRSSAFVGLGPPPRGPPHRAVPAPYADAGWLSAAEVAMLASMPKRREARAWARANTGRQGLAAMRAFQDAASELALLRRRMYHSAADEHALAHERELLEALRRPPRRVRRDAGHLTRARGVRGRRHTLALDRPDPSSRGDPPCPTPSTPRATPGALAVSRRIGPELVELRRRLHRIPELGLHLPDTQAVVLEALDGLDLEVTLGESLSSVVAVLRGRAPVSGERPVVLLRGDMDALPVTEEVDRRLRVAAARA